MSSDPPVPPTALLRAAPGGLAEVPQPERPPDWARTVPSLSTKAQAAPGPAGPTAPGGPCDPCGPVTPSSAAAIWVSFDLQAVSRNWILFLRLQMTTTASAAGASSAPTT